MKIHIYDIEWDTDGFEVDLPKEITANLEGEPDEDCVSNFLSDTYGWCHKGFNYEIVKENC